MGSNALLETKRINFQFKINIKKMAKEIFTVAGVMWALVLTGLSVGFGLLKIQGE